MSIGASNSILKSHTLNRSFAKTHYFFFNSFSHSSRLVCTHNNFFFLFSCCRCCCCWYFVSFSMLQFKLTFSSSARQIMYQKIAIFFVIIVQNAKALKRYVYNKYTPTLLAAPHTLTPWHPPGSDSTFLSRSRSSNSHIIQMQYAMAFWLWRATHFIPFYKYRDKLCAYKTNT